MPTARALRLKGSFDLAARRLWGNYLWGVAQGAAKAVCVVPAWKGPEAVRRPDRAGIYPPIAAPHHPLIRRGSARWVSHGGMIVIINIVPIRHPFPHVAR